MDADALDVRAALDELEGQLDVWLAPVRGLGEAGIRVPVGAKENLPRGAHGLFGAAHPHREPIHHLSAVCPLRDLHEHTNPATNGAPR